MAPSCSATHPPVPIRNRQTSMEGRTCSSVGPRHCESVAFAIKRRGRPEAFAPLLRENFLDLSQMVDVMAGTQHGYGLNRFLAALRVHAMVFTLRRGERLQQIEIRFA